MPVKLSYEWIEAVMKEIVEITDQEEEDMYGPSFSTAKSQWADFYSDTNKGFQGFFIYKDATDRSRRTSQFNTWYKSQTMPATKYYAAVTALETYHNKHLSYIQSMPPKRTSTNPINKNFVNRLNKVKTLFEEFPQVLAAERETQAQEARAAQTPKVQPRPSPYSYYAPGADPRDYKNDLPMLLAQLKSAGS
jgi:hypothetical protein